MAVVLKGACDEKSACQKPQFPSWAWRFNRNQYMTHYYPWQIREEQWPPNYRNMGVHRNFRFHPMGPNDGPRPFLQLGVNYCTELANDRRAGFGNAALGRTPGPAPPRLFPYGQKADDFYRINEINHISPGVSLFGYEPLLDSTSDEIIPLNPSHYLEKTLGQIADIPGSFPHFNKPLPRASVNPPKLCATQGKSGCTLPSPRDPLAIWRDRFKQQEARHAMEYRCQPDHPLSATYVGSGNPRFPVIGVDPQRKCRTARH